MVPSVAAAVLAAVTVCSSRPPTPPSAGGVGGDHGAPSGFKDQCKALFSNRAFIILMFVFGTGMGLFSTVLTFLEQILCTRGYTDAFTGVCGALLIGLGIIGAGVAGAIVDVTKRFEEVAKIAFALAAAGMCWMVVAAYFSAQPAVVAVGCAIFGTFGFAQYPIALELGLEATFPVPEAISTGFMIIMGQIISATFVIGSQLLATDFTGTTSVCDAKQGTPQDFTVPNLIMCGFGAAMTALFLLGFRTPYRRMEHEELFRDHNPTEVNDDVEVPVPT